MDATRQSTSSDTSSTISDATTLYSTTTKDIHSKDGAVVTVTKDEGEQHRRSLRQKARDVLHDLGSPPTKRQDVKDGKDTSNYAELNFLMGQGITGPQKI